ncbi:MAG: phage/plasmid primase, P4 family [Thermoplasmata archaeon]|nr:phage/plasmid primase, P4 family [Thermoplasmata archaeon]
MTDSPELPSLGYFLLPLPNRRKEPPPAGWVDRKERYEIPDGSNVAIGMRGEVACLITNDEPATKWAVELFGQPNVRTPRGAHWYFRPGPYQANEANRRTAVGLMELHVRNKYALVPPSIHPSGAPYEWVRPLPPVPELPAAPDLRDLWHPAGTHHAQLLSMSAAAAHAGKNAVTILADLSAYRDAHLPDPFAHPDAELRDLATSAAKKFKGADGSAAPQSHPEGGGPQRPLFFENGEPDRAAFVEAAMHRFALAAFPDTEELLLYRAGVYGAGARPAVKAWVETQFRSLGRTSSSAFVTEVLSAVIRRSYVPRAEFDPVSFVCVANGFLDLTDPGATALRPHDPAIRFTVGLPVSFDAHAKCPRFDEFLAQVLPEEPDQRDVRKLFGYCLLPGNSLQIAFMFLGDGCNGKSTLLGVLIALLGSENVSAETLQTLVSNRFAAARLWGKRANICADIPTNPVEFTGTFKLLTGGDQVRGENKFAHPFDFVNGAKLIFSANVRPEVSDRTIAFWRRWIVFRFGQSFIGRENRDLLDRLKSELSGVLNFALAGLSELIADGGFKSTRTTESLALDWKQKADPIFWFVNACVERDPGGWISKPDLYEAYTQFCEPRGCSYRKLEVFGKLLPTQAPWTRTERRSVLGKSVHGWAGIRLRPEVKEADPDLPAQPDKRDPGLPGWAGKSGTSTSPPGPSYPGPDPEDLFGGSETRADRARRPSDSRGA